MAEIFRNLTAKISPLIASPRQVSPDSARRDGGRDGGPSAAYVSDGVTVSRHVTHVYYGLAHEGRLMP